jgi:hypothetical protein
VSLDIKDLPLNSTDVVHDFLSQKYGKIHMSDISVVRKYLSSSSINSSFVVLLVQTQEGKKRPPSAYLK